VTRSACRDADFRRTRDFTAAERGLEVLQPPRGYVISGQLRSLDRRGHLFPPHRVQWLHAMPHAVVRRRVASSCTAAPCTWSGAVTLPILESCLSRTWHISPEI